ncbi:MAG: phosphatase PAP2 family protein [Candidatus Aminicenantes bacterium]|nr:phosphatase PAP2 family protein [Candidatus Aminicenantes bacterium]
MRKKKIVFCLIVLFLFQVGGAEESTEDSTAKKKEKKTFFKKIFADEGEIWTSPFKMKGKQLLTWGSVALITAILIENDEKLYRSTQEYQTEHKWVQDLSPAVRPLGDGNLNLGVAGGFYLWGLLFKDTKAKKAGELSLMSLIHAGIVVQLVKHLTGRKRPRATEPGVDHWEGPAGFFKRYKDHRDMYYDAFFSGHTVTAWSLATVVAKMYNKSFVVPVLCYSLATIAGLSNVTEGEHWYSDVFVGAVIGYAIGSFLVRKRWRRLQVLPLIEKDRMGLSFCYSLD